MEARDIKRYLADLGATLKNRGVKKPLRVMLIGGAYILPEAQEEHGEQIKKSLNMLFSGT